MQILCKLYNKYFPLIPLKSVMFTLLKVNHSGSFFFFIYDDVEEILQTLVG